jgi:hypothetical protein
MADVFAQSKPKPVEGARMIDGDDRDRGLKPRWL